MTMPSSLLRGVEADVVGNWGEGVAGAEAVKDKVEIRWIDGREHFKTLRENGRGTGLQGLNTPPAFLVADQNCIEAYIRWRAYSCQRLLWTRRSGRGWQ